MASAPPAVGTQRVIDNVVSALSANSDVPYRATLAEAVAEFPAGYYFKTDDKDGVGPHPGDLWIYQRTADAPGYVAQISGQASTVDINVALAAANVAVSEARAAATDALDAGGQIRKATWSELSVAAGTDGQIGVSLATSGTHASLAGDVGASGGQTPDGGEFRFTAGVGWVRLGATSSLQAQAAVASIPDIMGPYVNAAAVIRDSILATSLRLDALGVISGYTDKTGAGHDVAVRDQSGKLRILSQNDNWYGATPSANLINQKARGVSKVLTFGTKTDPDWLVLVRDASGRLRVKEQEGLPGSNTFGSQQSGGIPSGGKSGDLIAVQPDGTGGFLPVDHLLNVIQDLIPTVVTAAPANHEGMNNWGNRSYAIGRGPSANLIMVGVVLMNGSQAALTYNRKTGALVEAYVLRSGLHYDDHNTPSIQALPDGSFIVVTSGHNDDTVVRVSTRTWRGVWSFETLTYTGTTTYPSITLDRDGRLWLLVRVTNLRWEMRMKASASAPLWSASRVLVTDTQQTYITLRYQKETNTFYGWVSPNSLSARYGRACPIEFRLDDMQFYDGNGPLGFYSGAASSNGKSLPIVSNDVLDLATPPEGRRYGFVEHTVDTIILNSVSSTDATDATVEVWKLTGANRYNPAHWSKSGPITNYGGVRAGGSNNVLPGLSLAPEQLAYVRFYIVRFVSNQWRFEQWDNPSGDMTTWTTKLLHVVNSSDGKMFRPCVAQEGNDRTPVIVTLVDTFVEYDNYTNARIKFVEPWKVA